MSSTPTNISKREKVLDAQVTFDYIYGEYIKQIESKTKLSRKVIYIVCSACVFFFLIGRLEIFMTYLVTMYYPVLWCYEDYKSNDEDLIKMWGSYWGIFGIFIFLDCFHKYFIFYVPLYFFIRTIILLWMYLPCFKGSLIFYNIVFVELLKLTDLFRSRYDEKDSMLSEIQEKMNLKKKKD